MLLRLSVYQSKHISILSVIMAFDNNNKYFPFFFFINKLVSLKEVSKLFFSYFLQKFDSREHIVDSCYLQMHLIQQ